MRYIHYIAILLLTVALTACDNLMQHLLSGTEYGNMLSGYLEKERPLQHMEVIDVNFTAEYDTFTVTTRMLADGPVYQLKDSTHIRTEVIESIDGIRHTRLSTPRLVGIHNREAEGVAEEDARMLVLVDRTMTQEQLNSVRDYVSEIRTIFDNENLFVAFMDSGRISKTLPISDYILQNYFRPTSNAPVYLYRAMQLKREEILAQQGYWQGARYRIMLIFSNEQAYDDETNIPIDPDHYDFEEQLVHRDRDGRDTAFIAFYVNLNALNPDAGDNDDTMHNIPQVFCSLYGGDYTNTFQLTACKRKIYDAFHFDFPDNAFVFVNPNNKVYRGDSKSLTLNFYDRKTNRLVSSCTTTVSLGNIYKPIIVHGQSIGYVLVQGTLLTLFILLLVYFILQIVVPAIRYRIFKHKYVLSYTGPNMSFGGKAVGQSCYYCKAPFETGDNIVVKCEHTMHESCWEENDYHCTEYSDHCKHGSHYFNRYNLFDPRNATFYLKWLLVAIGAAFMSWLGFTIYMHLGLHNNYAPALVQPPITQLPVVGAVVGFFLTMGLSFFTLSVHGWRMAAQLIARSLLAAVGCYFTFLLANIFIVVFGIKQGIGFINALPWIASCFLIARAVTFGTRVVYNRRVLLLTTLVGILSVVIWGLFYQRTELDFRVTLLISFYIYCIGMAASIASISPRSERYFLKVQGAVKEMDIALYKWFRNDTNRVVTIGKSVECTLQLSWEIQRTVAPVQAEICKLRNALYLIVLEPGVYYKNRPVKVDSRILLYHGQTFSIGQTQFTYVEKDR